MRELSMSKKSPKRYDAEFRESPLPWLVVGRNAIPVLGVYGLGWSTGVTLLEVWFDGISSLGLMIAFSTWTVLRRDPDPWTPPAGLPRVPPILLGPLFASMPLLILGIPSWFALGAFHAEAFGEGFWRSVLGDREVLLWLSVAFGSNLIEHARRGWHRMSDSELRARFRWEYQAHLARIVALLLVLFVLPLGGIALLACALASIELHPRQAFRFLGLEDGGRAGGGADSG